MYISPSDLINREITYQNALMLSCDDDIIINNTSIFKDLKEVYHY